MVAGYNINNYAVLAAINPTSGTIIGTQYYLLSQKLYIFNVCIFPLLQGSMMTGYATSQNGMTQMILMQTNNNRNLVAVNTLIRPEVSAVMRGDIIKSSALITHTLTEKKMAVVGITVDKNGQNNALFSVIDYSSTLNTNNFELTIGQSSIFNKVIIENNTAIVTGFFIDTNNQQSALLLKIDIPTNTILIAKAITQPNGVQCFSITATDNGYSAVCSSNNQVLILSLNKNLQPETLPPQFTHSNILETIQQSINPVTLIATNVPQSNLFTANLATSSILAYKQLDAISFPITQLWPKDFITRTPSKAPVANPTPSPSIYSSTGPTSRPSQYPHASPTQSPQSMPTSQPSALPTNPTSQPSSSAPTMTHKPSQQPTIQPSFRPTTATPSTAPSAAPSTKIPTNPPYPLPSKIPTSKPSSTQPTFTQTTYPSFEPVNQSSNDTKKENTPLKLGIILAPIFAVLTFFALVIYRNYNTFYNLVFAKKSNPKIAPEKEDNSVRTHTTVNTTPPKAPRKELSDDDYSLSSESDIEQPAITMPPYSLNSSSWEQDSDDESRSQSDESEDKTSTSQSDASDDEESTTENDASDDIESGLSSSDASVSSSRYSLFDNQNSSAAIQNTKDESLSRQSNSSFD